MATLDTTPAASTPSNARGTARGFRLIGTVSEFKTGTTAPKTGTARPFVSFMIDGMTTAGKSVKRRVTGFGPKAISWLDVQPGAVKVGIFVAYDRKSRGTLFPIGPYMTDAELAAKKAA